MRTALRQRLGAPLESANQAASAANRNTATKSAS